MTAWPTFATAIRKIVASAIVIVEVLEAVLAKDDKLLKTIVKENKPHADVLRKFIRSARRASQTVGGRFEIDRLIDEYRFEAQWPTDDISLRRVYEIYRRGELGKRLPALERRIA